MKLSSMSDVDIEWTQLSQTEFMYDNGIRAQQAQSNLIHH